MKHKPGLEKLMKAKADLRELGGRVLLGDYPSDSNLGIDVESSCTGASLEMLATTFCRPGLSWAFGQMEGIFADYPDRTDILAKLVSAAGKAKNSGGMQEKNLILAIICEAEGIIEEMMSGRLTKIMKSVASLSPKG